MTWRRYSISLVRFFDPSLSLRYSSRQRTQVSSLNVIIFEQFLGVAFADDLAPFENVTALGERQHRLHILLDDEQTHAVAMQVGQNCKDRFNNFWREAERRLVEEKKAR